MKNNKELSEDLQELFDIRNSKTRDEKNLNQLAMEAQRDIRMITHMFQDDIPNVRIPMNDQEYLSWDSQSKRLMYTDSQGSLILEGASKQIMIKARPHLRMLVKAAQDFYKNS